MDKEYADQLDSVIDFLCWKFDTTGDTKYQTELKQLIKENEENGQSSNEA